MDKVCRKCIGRGWFDENRSRTVSRSVTARSESAPVLEICFFAPPGKKSEIGGIRLIMPDEEPTAKLREANSSASSS